MFVLSFFFYTVTNSSPKQKFKKVSSSSSVISQGLDLIHFEKVIVTDEGKITTSNDYVVKPLLLRGSQSFCPLRFTTLGGVLRLSNYKRPTKRF